MKLVSLAFIVAAWIQLAQTDGKNPKHFTFSHKRMCFRPKRK